MAMLKSAFRVNLVCATALGVATFGIAACGGGGASPDTPADAVKGEGSAAAAAFARVDRKPIPFKAVLASTLGGSAIEVMASTEDIDCAGAGKAPKAGEKRAKLHMSPTLSPDGKRQWKLVYAQYDNGTAPKDEALADFQLQAKNGVKVTLPQISVNYVEAGASKKVEFGGPITAQGCGDRTEDRADRRLQKDAVLEIAREKLTLQGAVLQRSAEGDTLIVSTRPIPCDNGVPGEDVRVQINLPKGQEASVLISGDLVPGMAAYYFGDKKPNVTPGAGRDGVVAVAVDLDEKHGDYAVTFKGSVQAALCER